MAIPWIDLLGTTFLAGESRIGKSPILILTDSAADGATVARVLEPEFGRVRATTLLGDSASDLDISSALVLLLVFQRFEKAQQCAQQLTAKILEQPDRARRLIVLCARSDMQRAFELARAGQASDYVVFWPPSIDNYRLRMAVFIAVREVLSSASGQFRNNLMAEQTQQLGQLESMITDGLSTGEKTIAAAGDAVANAGKQIGAALDGFVGGAAVPTDKSNAKTFESAELSLALAKVRREKIDAPLEGLSRSIEPISRWASGLRAELQPHLPSARSLVNSANRQSKLTLLIVDDSEVLRSTVRNMLAPNGILVVQAEGGVAAMNALHQHNVDIILMDLLMPDIDGLETMRRIRARERFSSIPIIVVSGRSDPNTVRECLAHGAADFIVKPFKIPSLLAKIERAVCRSW